MNDLITELSKRDEDTIVVAFGDHLPTMGLEDSDMKSGDIYKTKYVTWNNMGLKKQDADLYAYQLMASITDSTGIHEGTILTQTTLHIWTDWIICSMTFFTETVTAMMAKTNTLQPTL